MVYVAIVALWAAVLIPMWLRRHDDDQARRLDRHQTAMGTLATMSSPRATAAQAAARRRRMVLAALAIPGVVAMGAWILGFVSTVVVVAAFLPATAYAPLALLASRRSRVVAPPASRRTTRTRDELASDDVAVPETESSAETVAEPPVTRPAPRVVMAEWDEVFDQTA